MPLTALGINHTTAPVSLRERVAFAPDQMRSALGDLLDRRVVSEALILSTCNRTELYVQSESDSNTEIMNWLGGWHQVPDKELSPHVYLHEQEAAVRHLLRVACGLDSMVLGEPQILGQLKDAYQTASEAGSLGRYTDRLLQHAFHVAKQVRTDTAIGSSAVSVASAAVNLARQISGELDRARALLVGAGDTIELAARHLHAQGLRDMVVANRTLSKAQALAEEFSATAIRLDQIDERLKDADIVIASTASPEPVIRVDAVRTAVAARKHRPVFMVDLAVPRDIDAAVADLEDIFLYTVDDLQHVIQENMDQREQAAGEAEEIIDLNVTHFMDWIRARDAVPAITALRQSAEADRDAVVERALHLLRAGHDPEEVLRKLAHTLTGKLVHRPSLHMRKAGMQGDEEILRAARRLFQLDDDTS